MEVLILWLVRVLIIAIVLVVALMGFVLWSIWLNRRQNETLREKVDKRLETVTQQMLDATTSIGERLDRATKVVGDVREKLGALSQTAERWQEIGQDIASLQELLKPPQLRGGLGETFLDNLLSQILPPNYYTLQHTFRSTGARVDALIDLGTGKMPVDSKFPLESFQRMTESQSEEGREANRREFIRRVKKHIDTIADKYILPDEGTFDFALMYIPAENVYYETIVREEGIFDYALEKKVVPVSPNSFYAYLQVIVLGLKGLRIESKAQEILDYLGRLCGDFQRFQEDFKVLGGHIRRARDKYEEADRRLVRFSDKLLSVSELPIAELESEETAESLPSP